MKKIISVLFMATMIIAISCNNSSPEDNKVKKEDSRQVEEAKKTVIEVPVPPPPPLPPSPKEVLKNLKKLPPPPLPPLPPPPPKPKRKG